MVVLHYTGMETAGAALGRLRDPGAEVSAHYLIDESGCVFALVPEDRRAWHAGLSEWAGVRDVNSRSIGIELANPGLGPLAHPFPHPQMLALEGLLAGILARHAILPGRVVGHACIAPGRKVDPGPRFDWRRLAVLGLSVWPEGGVPSGGTDAPESGAARFRAAARRFGYPLAERGGWDDRARAVWDAFAERFAPRLAGKPGAEAGLVALEALAERWPAAPDAVDPARRSG